MKRMRHLAGRVGASLVAAAMAVGSGCSDRQQSPTSQPASRTVATPAAAAAPAAPAADAPAYVAPPRPRVPTTQALSEAKAKWIGLATPEQAKALDQQIAALAPLPAAAVKLGNKAPDFDALATDGNEVTLAGLLKSGPVVLVWFRGGWCQFCSIQLAGMQEILPQIEQAGATLAAISPQTVEYNRKTADNLGLEYELLSDAGNLAARKWGLIYALSDDMMETLRGRVDLGKCNGDKSGELPMTAVYVIDTDGVVKYAAVDPDFRNRPDPQAVLAALKDPTKVKPVDRTVRTDEQPAQKNRRKTRRR
ncbi:MAG: AhpC/TSA family protein [Planctomycetaceae bacterium]|nr:AhpC/TSA family protein [Planctomycetaceae bacterium]